MKLFVVFGANLNKLGSREKIYGNFTIDELKQDIVDYCGCSCDVEFCVSNREGELIDAIQNCDADAVILNAGGFSHTSVAIADALRMLNAFKIEVHLTNIFGRESFRHDSITAAACDGVICGFSVDGYKAAIDLIKARLNK